ncbi:hypothetical protein I5G67_gp099 [Mycobacterium phage Aminay]|uniref:Uncharacterized protein n=1 Tax=Mycobacterium phage Aminay TaxID=2250291 RepID=A0A345KV83_9CAUD|nr:hypothetical protein I5G67_gp099 [Mycobacterium phage Aminay]AXH46935.1 hypothetical protein SEA_AMINAY_99 [Mycobacterium phage Aminay]
MMNTGNHSSREWCELFNSGRADTLAKHRTTSTANLKNHRSRVIVTNNGRFDQNPYASGVVVALADLLSARGALS